MNDEAIHDRARKAGLAVDWIDVVGQPQRVRTESLRLLLEALPDSDERTETPPLVTAQVWQDVRLPNLSDEVDLPAELALEGGDIRPLTLRGGSAPAIDQPGYHRLRFVDREITLAVAPERCATLDEVGAGQRMWGVAAQIYGLRRNGGGGIGDAGAVRDLAEAAARQGADALALSPVHSLFAADLARYSPYSPSSRMFFNPLHADPSAVFDAGRIAACLPQGREALEGSALIDWPAEGAAKFALLRCLFDDFAARDLTGGTGLAADFERFVREGGETLQAHAAFEAQHAGSQRYHLFLQWLTQRSFAAAQKAARQAGMRIGLISDLAIGMDPAGSHAWARPEDLLPGLSIGAPPDAFNPRGQDWGLTSFSPHTLVTQGFAPFLATLRAALSYAGGVRIDHAMGLMRLWLIPRGAAASEGAYLTYPFEDLLRLLALESHRHRAIVIGEDLGTVPPGFRARLAAAGIAGMDVMWFERTHLAFAQAAHWRSDAVATTTTHDLPTVAGWWTGEDIRTRRTLGLSASAEDQERAEDRVRLWQAFADAGVVQGPPPPNDQPAAAVDAALAYVAQSPSRLMLAPLEDLLGLVEQPNLPGTIDEHPNWRRRLPSLARDLFEAPAVRARAEIIARHRS